MLPRKNNGHDDIIKDFMTKIIENGDLYSASTHYYANENNEGSKIVFYIVFYYKNMKDENNEKYIERNTALENQFLDAYLNNMKIWSNWENQEVFNTLYSD